MFEAEQEDKGEQVAQQSKAICGLQTNARMTLYAGITPRPREAARRHPYDGRDPPRLGSLRTAQRVIKKPGSRRASRFLAVAETCNAVHDTKRRRHSLPGHAVFRHADATCTTGIVSADQHEQAIVIGAGDLGMNRIAV